MTLIEFNLSDVKCFLKYRYLFKPIGLEIWLFNRKRSILLVFDDQIIQNTVYKYF